MKTHLIFNHRYSIFLVLPLVFAICAIFPTAFAATATVNITPGSGANLNCVTAKNCFDPMVLNISPGDSVTWTNSDTVAHTTTSGQPTDNVTGTVWDSSLIKAGGNYTTPAGTFKTAGIYNYFCDVHPWMTGQIIVSSSGQNTRVTLSHLGIFDTSGNQITGPVQAGQQILFRANLTDNQNKVQPTTFILQIKNGAGVTVDPEWITETLTNQTSGQVALAWTPSYSGNYTAQVFVWPAINVPLQLSGPATLQFTVQGGQNHRYTAAPVVLSGAVSPPIHNNYAFLLIHDPTHVLVQIARAPVGSDGKFSTKIIAGGPDFNMTGTYQVLVYYFGLKQNSLSFNCTSISPVSCTAN